MQEKNTLELEKILGSTHLKNFDSYLEETGDAVDDNSFQAYMRGILKEKKLIRQDVFLLADIPERYGYKLLSGEKRTRHRDVILRICYAAEMTLEETQRALKKYEMPTLYAKNSRDSLLMLIFNERPGSIIDVNAILKEHNMELLRSCGVQD